MLLLMGIWCRRVIVNTSNQTLIIAIDLYVAMVQRQEWVVPHILKEEAQNGIDTVGFCKSRIHIRQVTWHIASPLHTSVPAQII